MCFFSSMATTHELDLHDDKKINQRTKPNIPAFSYQYNYIRRASVACFFCVPVIGVPCKQQNLKYKMPNRQNVCTSTWYYFYFEDYFLSSKSRVEITLKISYPI